MAKKKQKGIKLIHVIIVIAIIVVAIIVWNNIQKNKKQEKINNITNQLEKQEQEKNVKVLEDNTKLNISNKLNENKKFGELQLKDIQLTYKNGVTNLLCNIENISDKKVNMQEVEIALLDENGEVIYKIPGVIEDIEAGATVQFNTSISADFANAYNFEILKK